MDNEALRDVKGSLSEYVLIEAPARTIRNEFHRFLVSFVDEHGIPVSGEKIKAMCEGKNFPLTLKLSSPKLVLILPLFFTFSLRPAAESQTLEIDFNHLVSSNATLGYFLGNAPAQILPLFDQVAMEVTLSGFEDYDKICEEIHVRVANVPQSETLRDLRQSHLNTLIKVTGVVTRRTAVYPQLRYVKYGCVKCGAMLGPFYQDNDREIKVRKCANCQSKGPFTLNSEEVLESFVVFPKY